MRLKFICPSWRQIYFRHIGLHFTPLPYYLKMQVFQEREIGDNAHRQAWDSSKMLSQCGEACASGKDFKPLMTKYILEKY